MNIRLKEIREKKAMSQEETAEMMHISQSAYARFETTKTKIDLDRLESFAQAMGMTVIDVLTYPDKYVNSSVLSSDDFSDATTEVTLQIKVKESQKKKVLEMVLGAHN